MHGTMSLSSGLALCLLLWAPVAPAESAPAAQAEAGAPDTGTSPVEVVETLHRALLEIMQQAQTMGFEGRFDHIKPVVAETFDLEFMASKSVGRHWKIMSPEQQATWLEKFSHYISANYAGNFESHSGETFETLGEESAKRDTRLVRTTLRVPSDKDVIFNYRLRETPEGWKVIDIYLKGTVSELALRRSDFSTTLKQKGFAELALAVDRKIDQLRAANGG